MTESLPAPFRAKGYTNSTSEGARFFRKDSSSSSSTYAPTTQRFASAAFCKTETTRITQILEEGSYLRLIDVGITQLLARYSSRRRREDSRFQEGLVHVLVRLHAKTQRFMPAAFLTRITSYHVRFEPATLHVTCVLNTQRSMSPAE